MGVKNGLVKKISDEIMLWRQAERETYMQFMTDTLIDVLNDKEVMGNDAFGKVRIKRVVTAWGARVAFWHPALEHRKKDQDASWWRTRFDDRIRSIVGEENFTPYEERYPWVDKLKDF